MKYTRNVAINVVIANMIGTGVFFSLGFQVGDIPSWFSIMILWIIGAIIALLGALCYSEISTRIAGSGGEYNYLSKIYHPALGFIAGWVSFIVGFAAPIAVVALGIGIYTSEFLKMDSRIIASCVIFITGTVHLFGVKSGGLFQNIVTRIKLVFIVSLIFLPIVLYFFGDFQPTNQILNPFKNGVNDMSLIFSPEFAIALVWCYLAYSGWNAAVYFSDKIENPVKNIPYSLIIGTLIVSVLYLFLNSSFLYAIDMENIKPVYDPETGNLIEKIDVGNAFLHSILPDSLANPLSLMFGVALFSSLSSMLIAGPSVLETMGNDYITLKVLNKRNRYYAPYISICCLMTLSIILVYSAGFKELVEYIGVILSIFSVLVVLGIPILRNKKDKEHNIYKAPFGNILAIVFSTINMWMIYHLISSDIWVLFAVLITLLSGFILYKIIK
jgi:APA family basic amino acid/polyamine antiporter